MDVREIARAKDTLEFNLLNRHVEFEKDSGVRQLIMLHDQQKAIVCTINPS